MSSSETSATLSDDTHYWCFGIPWTVMHIKLVLEQAAPTMDPSELELRRKAIEQPEPEQPGRPNLYQWANATVGAIIGKDPEELETQLCKDPSMAFCASIDVLVFCRKRGISESALQKSQYPTDAQLEKLKSNGWEVKWYKAMYD